MTTGTLDVLNCGAGHLKFSFDSKDPMEVERAKRVVEDMLQRGYALFIQVGKETRRVLKFDAKKAEYLIADGPLYAGEGSPSGRATKGTRLRAIPAKSAKATAIAPTAGG